MPAKSTKKPAVKATKAKVALPTDAAALKSLLAEKQSDQLTAKLSHKSGELVNPRSLKELRRDIARIKTAMNAEKGVK